MSLTDTIREPKISVHGTTLMISDDNMRIRLSRHRLARTMDGELATWSIYAWTINASGTCRPGTALPPAVDGQAGILLSDATMRAIADHINGVMSIN